MQTVQGSARAPTGCARLLCVLGALAQYLCFACRIRRQTSCAKWDAMRQRQRAPRCMRRWLPSRRRAHTWMMSSRYLTLPDNPALSTMYLTSGTCKPWVNSLMPPLCAVPAFRSGANSSPVCYTAWTCCKWPLLLKRSALRMYSTSNCPGPSQRPSADWLLLFGVNRAAWPPFTHLRPDPDRRASPAVHLPDVLRSMLVVGARNKLVRGAPLNMAETGVAA